MIKNRLLVSHTDLDGMGSLVIAMFYKTLLGFDDFMSEDYGFEEDEDKMALLQSYRQVVFADITVSEEGHKKLIEAGVDVIYFDHHEAASHLHSYEKMTYDNERCGTKIFWEDYVRPKLRRYPVVIDEFVELVNTYDLWKRDDELWQSAKNLNSVLYGIRNYTTQNIFESCEPFFDLMHTKFRRFEYWYETDKEKRLIDKSEAREKEIYDMARGMLSLRIDKKGNTFGVFAAPSKISLVASSILREEPELDYLVIVNTWGGVTGKLSFRSQNGFNCNDLGAANGHEAAAGGEILPEMAVEFLRDPSLAFTYNEDFNEEDIKTALERIEDLE